jgi:hypothetical protein
MPRIYPYLTLGDDGLVELVLDPGPGFDIERKPLGHIETADPGILDRSLNFAMDSLLDDYRRRRTRAEEIEEWRRNYHASVLRPDSMS